MLLATRSENAYEGNCKFLSWSSDLFGFLTTAAQRHGVSCSASWIREPYSNAVDPLCALHLIAFSGFRPGVSL